MARAEASGNADEIIALLGELESAFDFTLPGESGSSFGEDLMDIFSVGVFDRTVGDGKSPDGSELAPNRGKYGEDKIEAGLPVGIGMGARDHDSMLSLVQLKGERVIERDQCILIYGLPGSFARSKANYFTYGSSGSAVTGEYSGAKGQPERPFWGFDESIEAALVRVCEGRLEATIRRLGG